VADALGELAFKELQRQRSGRNGHGGGAVPHDDRYARPGCFYRQIRPPRPGRVSSRAMVQIALELS
jgi:hypothetical protein